jgi:hypothetical protein
VLHEVEYVDGIHVQVGEICRRLNFISEMLRQGLCAFFPSIEQVVDELISNSAFCGFEDGTGPVLQHFLHLFF